MNVDQFSDIGKASCYCPDCFFRVTQQVSTQVLTKAFVGSLHLNYKQCCRCEGGNDQVADPLCSACSGRRHDRIMVSSSP